MSTPDSRRVIPLEISPEEFCKIGHELIDSIGDFLTKLPDSKVTRGESPKQIRQILGNGSLPFNGTDTGTIVREAASLMFDHSLFNGHPRFWGYITSSAAPIGALGDLLAASVNPNLGSFSLAPIATEIESQTIRWIAEMIGYPVDCGGITVSGGNMANFVCFLAARKAKTPWDLRTAGLASGPNLRLYASTETHTWIQKAADMYGLGTDAICWIPVDEKLRMRIDVLREKIHEDKSTGVLPFLVVGSAGTVGTGAIDPLPEISQIAHEHNLWFHVDGAYGALAAVLPDASNDIHGIAEADSVAVDPHKWLYTPLEAGCALVRDRKVLRETFMFRPPYYRFDGDPDDEPTNYFEYGPQNSRGFRSLKVWLALRQVGRKGYERMIADDISLAAELFKEIQKYPELQAFTHGLSITTFRYVPADMKAADEGTVQYLNELNTEILTRLQKGGKAYLSNAVIGGAFVLRACIVNFRTTKEDIEALPEIVVRMGSAVDKEMRRRPAVKK